tara:strand:+ start:1589 stop:1951 length:363 start_codon:yes stop_codon:yes gene_type:complete
MSGKRKFDSPKRTLDSPRRRQKSLDRKLMDSIQRYQKNNPLPTAKAKAQNEKRLRLEQWTENGIFNEMGLNEAAEEMLNKKPLTSGKIKKKKKKKTAKRRKRSSSSSRRRKKKRRRRTAK